MTNYERIKLLTPQELARLMWTEECLYCPVQCNKIRKGIDADCRDELERWLAETDDGSIMRQIYPNE